MNKDEIYDPVTEVFNEIIKKDFGEYMDMLQLYCYMKFPFKADEAMRRLRNRALYRIRFLIREDRLLYAKQLLIEKTAGLRAVVLDGATDDIFI